MTGSVPVAQVRIINASPDAPGMDIYQGGSALAHNLAFGTVTSYVAIAPGSSSIAADAAGSKQQMTLTRGTFTASGQYTVLIGNVAGELTQTLLTDQAVAAPSGQISVRFLDQASRFATGVDVYFVPAGSTITTASPVLTNVEFGTNSGYINVPSGIYSVVLLPTGSMPDATTVPIYTGAKVTYATGVVRTLILLDQQIVNEPGFQMITANDFDVPAMAN